MSIVLELNTKRKGSGGTDFLECGFRFAYFSNPNHAFRKGVVEMEYEGAFRERTGA